MRLVADNIRLNADDYHKTALRISVCREGLPG